jgi:hypothetical protein
MTVRADALFPGDSPPSSALAPMGQRSRALHSWCVPWAPASPRRQVPPLAVWPLEACHSPGDSSSRRRHQRCRLGRLGSSAPPATSSCCDLRQPLLPSTEMEHPQPVRLRRMQPTSLPTRSSMTPGSSPEFRRLSSPGRHRLARPRHCPAARPWRASLGSTCRGSALESRRREPVHQWRC